MSKLEELMSDMAVEAAESARKSRNWFWIMIVTGAPCLIFLFIPSLWVFIVFLLPIAIVSQKYSEKHDKSMQRIEADMARLEELIESGNATDPELNRALIDFMAERR